MSVAAIAAGAAGVAGGLAGPLLENYQANKQARWQEHLLEYNKPVNQVARLREAGLNPALAMGEGQLSPGNSSSSGSYDIGSYDFSPAGNAIGSSVGLLLQKQQIEAQSRKDNATAQGQEIRNNNEQERSLLELENLRADLAKKGKDTTYVDKMISYKEKEIDAFDKRNAAEVMRIQNEAKKYERESQLLDLQTEYQRIVNQYAPAQQDKLLRQIDAHTKELLSAAYEHNKSGLKAAAESALAGVDKETKEKLMPHLIDEAESKANEAYWNSEKAGRDYLLGPDLGRTPAIDYFNGGHSYESPNAQFRDSPSRHRGRSRRTDLDHVR